MVIVGTRTDEHFIRSHSDAGLKKKTEVILVVKVSVERGQRRWQPGKGEVYESCP